MNIDPAVRRIAAIAQQSAWRGSVLLLSAALAGCGLPQKISDSAKVDYKSANQKTKPVDLEVPPDLSNPRSDERYSIPEREAESRTLSGYQRNQVDRSERVASAGDARVLPGAAGVRVERDGATRYLVVDRSPDQLWPVLKEFWQESGFVVDRDDPATGIMETDWVENRAKLPQDFIRNTLGRVFDSLYSTGERDRFRTRLERRADGGTEVYISHRGMIEVVNNQMKDSTVWQPRPNDPELEAEFLRRLVVKLGGGEPDRAKTMVAAAAPAATADAGLQLINDPNAPRLDIGEGFDRAWRRVGLALDRGSFTVEDRDRSQGVYYVRYIDPEAEAKASGKGGFFSKWFSSSKKDSAASRQYRVRVAETGANASQVTVLGREGQQVTAEADRSSVSKILSLLSEQLKQ
ncbi:MAG: outer membrane protein assembly factor BamC [Burkholderiaceae bacterium]